MSCGNCSSGKPCCKGKSTGYGSYGFGAAANLTTDQMFQLQKQQQQIASEQSKDQFRLQKQQISSRQNAEAQQRALAQRSQMESMRLTQQGRASSDFTRMMSSAMRPGAAFIVPTTKRSGGGAVVAVSIIVGVAVIGGIMFAVLKSL